LNHLYRCKRQQNCRLRQSSTIVHGQIGEGRLCHHFEGFLPSPPIWCSCGCKIHTPTHTQIVHFKCHPLFWSTCWAQFRRLDIIRDLPDVL
jgi:hypothetical protein